MKILTELTYYRPHTSGLTIYAERLAKAFIQLGHEVTILTSRYDKKLLNGEIIDGIRIVRAPVLMHISKGVVMPTIGFLASKLVIQNDVIHLHLPQLDAAGIALRGRLLGKPTVLTYHCDLKMPLGILSWAANQGVHLMNNIAASFADQLVAYTQDYANHSAFLRRYKKKLRIIPPPVLLPRIDEYQIKKFVSTNRLQNNFPVIGMAARFASEKGIEVLLNALPKILKVFPETIICFAGPHQNIVGEEKYIARLMPKINTYRDKGCWKFLGILSPEEMAAFYPNIDMLVIPSLNSTEAFGLVQIEAMLHGVPCIASNLPGVRQPIHEHKMGKIIPIGDSDALAEAVIDIARKSQKRRVKSKEFNKYLPDSVAKNYELLFRQLLNETI